MSAESLSQFDQRHTGGRTTGLRLIYYRPADPAAFDDHFFKVHAPLTLRLPGLRGVVTRCRAARSVGESDAYLIETLYFDDLSAIGRAFSSPIGKEWAADRRFLAPSDAEVRMYVFDGGDVDHLAASHSEN
jgi:uncharacterized protein (TIGR02118 family)